MSERLIDTSGDTPRIKVGALVVTTLATVVWGYAEGLLGFIDGVGGGISSSLIGLGVWLKIGVIGRLFWVGAATLDAAAAENAAFVGSFGAFGIVVAIVEGIVVVYVILWGLSTIATVAWRAI